MRSETFLQMRESTKANFHSGISTTFILNNFGVQQCQWKSTPVFSLLVEIICVEVTINKEEIFAK